MPFATELVVCDTGSHDQTRDIAAAAGAVVVTADWQDDFAAARNAALAACGSDWVFSVDADELVSGVPAWLSAMLCACGTELDALSVQIDNTSAPDDSAGLHRELKLFRPAACRWAGRVHERLIPLDGRPLRTADLPAGTLRIDHHGYDDAEIARAKAERNAVLAGMELSDLHAAGASSAALAETALHAGRSLYGAGRSDLALAPLRLAEREGSPDVQHWARIFLGKCAQTGSAVETY
jgi:glycosyltransferase involved in cell wall biosynthesis